jgi:site-specific DNA recombinase
VDDRGAGIYARQSKGDDTSVEDQVRRGKARCTTLGLSVFGLYRDKVSASRFGTESGKQREDWPRLVEDVQANRLGFVWLWDVSRADRTPETWHPFLSACRTLKVLIYSERDDFTYRPWIPRDWKTLADSGNDAAYESEIKSVDVRRGVAEAAVDGRPHGIPPTGYDRVYDAHDRRSFTQTPNQYAEAVREIILRVGKRDPISQIQRDLQKRYPSKKWPRQTIRQIAGNLAYAGIRVHKTEVSKGVFKTELSEGNWPPIVDRKALEDARAVLAEPDRKSAPPGALTYLLSYLMVGPHGDVNTHPSKEGRAPRYRCLADGCTSVGMPEADEYVTRVALARLSRPDARELFSVSDKALDDAHAQVSMIEAEARELEVEVKAGRMRPALAAINDAAIQERLTAARARVQALSGNAVAFALVGDGKFSAETARPRWESLSVPARRSIISLLFTKIELLPRSEDARPLTRWSTDADRLLMAEQLVNVSLRS